MVYADPTRGVSGSRRPVSAISWCPDGGTKLAVGYCSPEFQGVGEACPAQGYTFAVEDPTKHCDTLTCPSPLTSLVESYIHGHQDNKSENQDKDVQNERLEEQHDILPINL